MRERLKVRELCAVVAAALIVGPAGAGVTSVRGANRPSTRTIGTPTVDPGCKVIFDATDKTLDTPNHAYAEQTDAAGKKTTSELITLNGQRYLFMNGKWSKSLMTVAETKAQEEENKKNAKVVTCKRVGNDSVNGQSATVYSEHTETEESKADGKSWISSNGVLLKTEIVLDPGDQTSIHIAVRYEYGNVKAPI